MKYSNGREVAIGDVVVGTTSGQLVFGVLHEVVTDAGIYGIYLFDHRGTVECKQCISFLDLPLDIKKQIWSIAGNREHFFGPLPNGVKIDWTEGGTSS